MKTDLAKKVNYGTRNIILNVVIVILILTCIIFVIMGISDLSRGHSYSTSTLSYYLETGEYPSLLNAYSSDYDPTKNYKDEELLSCYAAAEYYMHLSLFLAADACNDTITAQSEQALMDDAYQRMGQYQSYASDMYESILQ